MTRNNTRKVNIAFDFYTIIQYNNIISTYVSNISLFSRPEIPGPTVHSNSVYDGNEQRYNNRKNTNGNGHSIYPKSGNTSNNANYSTKQSPNRSLMLHYRPRVKIVVACSTIIGITTIKKFLTRL